MLLTERHIIKKSNPLYVELDKTCFLSKNLYNQALYRIRQHYFSTKEYLNYYSYKIVHDDLITLCLQQGKTSAIQEFKTMKKYTNTVNVISIFILFFAILGISTNVLAQDYTCPSNAHMRDINIDSVNSGLENDAYVMKTYTGYSTPDEAQLHCDQMIKEKTARVNEFHIDDYDGTITKIKREIDETKVLLEQQAALCNVCLASKLDAYEKRFIKKHGDHRYDTKGYRTKVVVVWGEAERIPTDAQAKYDLLYDEYMSEYDPFNDRQDCFKSTQACNDASETEAKISSLNNQISELRERHNNEVSAQYDLEKTVSLCSDVSKSIEKYNAKVSLIAFLKTCKYPEEVAATSSNVNTESNQNVNMNSLQQSKKAINNVRSVSRTFGF